MQYTEHYDLNKPEHQDCLLVQNSNDNMDVIDLLVKDIEDDAATEYDFLAANNAVYPVGSVFFTMNASNIPTFGTWVPIENRFILCCGTNHPAGEENSNTEVVITEANIPAHRHVARASGSVDTTGDHTHTNNCAYAFHFHNQVLTYGTGAGVTTNRVVADSGCTASATTGNQFYINKKTGNFTTEHPNQIKVGNKDTSEAGAHTHTFVGAETETSQAGASEPIALNPRHIPVFAFKRIA